MFDLLKFIILSILQGLFEWLPISSSGQVMIFSINVFGIPPDQAFSLAIWLHLGTTIAVLLKFRTDYIKIIQSFLPNIFEVEDIDIKKRNWVIFATTGTAITALPLYFLIKDSFSAFQGDLITLIISGFLIITGIILLKMRKDYGKNAINDIEDQKIFKHSFLAGLIQGCSILPGISRSGVTVSTILGEKYEHSSALKLSFLMSVPVAIASIGIDIIFGEGSILGTLDPIIIILSTLISFGVGYLTIEFLIRVAQKIQFGYFCILYGIISIIIIIPILLISSI